METLEDYVNMYLDLAVEDDHIKHTLKTVSLQQFKDLDQNIVPYGTSFG